MAKYQYRVKNYHAIKEANILLDGITVLAGANGCGKSTLSRWLYYIVNTTSNFEHIQQDYLLTAIISEVEKACRFFRGTALYNKYQKYSDMFLAIPKNTLGFQENVENTCTSFILQLENDLRQNLDGAPTMFIRRAYNYFLSEDNPSSDINDFVSRYTRYYDSFVKEKVEVYKQAIDSRSLAELNDVIKQEYGNRDSMPDQIELFEDGVALFSDNAFSASLMLNNAIYIDTPMVLSDQARPERGSIWDRFRKLLKYSNNISCSTAGTVNIANSIRNTIQGNVKLVEDELGFSKELHYTNDAGLDIKIEDAATGIKSFAYILRLIENCWITGESILMIDEPEAHLHPQWVVEFAKLLVLIHKYIGAKIVIASHDPDMIAAIHDMSEYYGLSEETNFYFAKKSEEGGQYQYINLCHEIDDIFESFNIALVRIKDYSTGR